MGPTTKLSSDAMTAEPTEAAFGRSVRNVPDQEFDAILTAGFFADTLYAPPEPAGVPDGLHEPPTDFVRPVAELTVMREDT